MTAARLAVLVLVVSGTASASAQTTEPPAIDEATRAELARLRDEAIAHDDAGRYALAAQRYEELYEGMRAVQHPRASVALWNRGLALMQIAGREQEARDAFERFLDESASLGDDPEIAAFRSEAPARIAEIDARVATAPDEPDPAPVAAPEEGGSVSPIGPVVLGVGGAIVVAGLVLGGVALSVDADFEDMCPTRMNCPKSTRSTYDNATALAAIADVMWIGGVVFGGVGLVLTFALDGDEPEPNSASVEPSLLARGLE